MRDPIHVTIWNEYLHEVENEVVRDLYPQGIHTAIAEGITPLVDVSCRGATLAEPEHGLSAEVLMKTDVLIWWGHKAHDRVVDNVVERVYQHVLSGMGLIVLQSGHLSKIFRRVMGANCSLKWREADEKERIWNLAPAHPIMEGIGDYFELPQEEMYGERFDVPEPEELLMISWFQGGEVFRSGCTWRRGHGRIFYFRPGHETYPTYHNDNVLRVIANACVWARRRVTIDTRDAPNAAPLEPVPHAGKDPIL
jgi:trehalose utilization protein